MSEDIINLKESKDFFENLFRYMNSAVFIIDNTVRVQCVNDSFKRLFKKYCASTLKNIKLFTILILLISKGIKRCNQVSF